MRKVLFCLVCHLCCLCIPAHAQFSYKEVQPAVFFAQVPFTMNRGQLIIHATVNGRQGKFLLDSGAPDYITTGFAASINAKPTTSSPTMDANNNKADVPVVEIDSLQIGKVVFKHIPTMVSDIALMHCDSVDGIIGQNIFSNAIIRVDGTTSLFSITNDLQQLSYDQKTANTIRFLSETQRIPFVEVKMKKIAFPVMIDLGYYGMLALSNKSPNYNFLKATGTLRLLEEGYGNSIMSAFDAQKSEKHYRVLIPEMIIGSTAFKNVFSETIPFMYSIMGTGILDYGIITIDYLRKLFHYQPLKDKIFKPDSQWPITTTISKRKLLIGVVWDKALLKKIKPGYEVVKMNHVNYANIDVCEMIRIRSPLRDTNDIHLSVKDEKAKLLEVVIQKKPIGL